MIDFRDPDCTMTHFRNLDVKVVLGSINPTAPIYQPTYLAPIGATIPAGSTAIPLDQYGMEYNPIAINEALAYSFQSATNTQTNRFFVELVNTLTQTGHWGCQREWRNHHESPEVSTLDLSLANYDMVITADDPVSRPYLFTGQPLRIPSANYYGQIPFNQATSTTNPLVHRGRRRAAHTAVRDRGDQQPADGHPAGHRLSDQSALSDQLLLRDWQPSRHGH